MSYVKNYDVGNVRIDEPHTHFIHELPLLSFSDVQHTIGLSLIFRSRLMNNAFNISEGYKLNLHKRLVLTPSDIPAFLEDGNGTICPLSCYGDRFMFQDGSQRIIRRIGSTYVLENPDYSKETYDSYGRIKTVCDKYGNVYLTYQYSDGKLETITYRNNKVININYFESVGMVESIQYICDGEIVCTTNFSYPGANNVTVNHYSGVEYHITYNNGEYDIYSCNEGETYSNSFSQRLTCNLSESAFTVERKLGACVIDTTRYDFVCHTEEGDFDLLEVTNNNGVQTRIQYADGKPAYSYEYWDSFEDMFRKYQDDVHKYEYIGNVAIHSNKQVAGTQTYADGERLQCTIDNGGMGQYEFSGLMNYHGPSLLSGWLRSTLNVGDCYITFYNNGKSVGCVPIGNIKGDWTYFIIPTPYDNFNNVKVKTSFSNTQVGACDFRILTQTSVFGNNHISQIENGLITKNESNEAIVVMLDAETVFYNGDSEIDQDQFPITVNDIIRYKTNQVYGDHKNEIYYNNGRGVILNAGALKAKRSYGATSFVANVENACIGKEYTLNGKTYSVLTEYQLGIAGDHSILETTAINNIVHKAARYNKYFDLEFFTDDGISTTYERNDHGLIVSQKISDSANNQIDTTINYDSGCTKVLSMTDEFGSTTTYRTDNVWGTVKRVILCDGHSVDTTYDDDGETLLSKKFANEKTHAFSYLNSHLASVSDGAINFAFESTSLTNGENYKIKKFGSTIENHQYIDNNGDKVLTSSYPTAETPSWQIIQRIDKYGRTTQIDGVLSNTYDIAPTYDISENNDSGYDCGGSKLAASEDLITGNVTRYAYEKDALSVVTEYDSSKTTVLNQERFFYDGFNRLYNRTHEYDTANNQFVNEKITYATDSNAVAVHSYTVNDVQKALTENSFDTFNRVNKKKVTMNSRVFTKDYSYDKTRITRLDDTAFGKNLGTNRYYYDSMGRIKSVIYSSVDGTDDYKTYEYDQFGQLIKENNEALDKTIVYQYNEVGNIVNVKEYAFCMCSVPKGEYTETTYSYSSSRPDIMTRFNGHNIHYDDLGCPEKYNGKLYTWEKGKLVGIKTDTEDQTGTQYEECTFAYNAYGQRISKNYTVQQGADSEDWSYTYNIEYNYDYSGRLIREFRVQTTDVGSTFTRELTYLYDENGMIGFVYSFDGSSACTYYYHRNLQGDVIAIYDTNGTKQAEYAYDAFGNCTVLYSGVYDIANNNPIRYRGYYYDRETGLYYLNARYYNPEWRRFISPDDTGYLDPDSVNGLNLYCYCNNDPVNYVDPSGHLGIGLTLLIATGVGLAFGFGIEVAKQVYNDGDWNWDPTTWNWWELGKASLIGAATGFAYGLGGVAGGIIKGSFKALIIAGKALNVSQSVGVLLGTAALTNFTAGIAGYAMHTAGSETESFNVLKAVSEGVGQAGKGVHTFFTGGLFVASGIWKVGLGAKNTIGSMIVRSAGKYVVSFLPNYFFENLF